MRGSIIALAASAAVFVAGCGEAPKRAAHASSCDDAAYSVAAGYWSNVLAADLRRLAEATNAHRLADVVRLAPSLRDDAAHGAQHVASTNPCHLAGERARFLRAFRLYERAADTIAKIRPDGSNLETYSATVGRLLNQAHAATPTH